MDPVDLDDLLDRELAQLPQPRAPRTLLPRVLDATAGRTPAAAAPTGWSTWPWHWRGAAAAAVVALAAVVWTLLTAPPAPVTGVAQTASETATVLRVVWDVLLQPVATYVFVLGISLTLACAAAWAALEVALGGASHR
ncbi:MAG TPA: hypothetical protein VM364_23100 [Vicinamibacterales bacterium]|nr:hypothetical protein [Vicinamibacterales bacterium]